jgi:hypothetical protein
VLPSRHRADRPVLITEAPINADEEFEHRRRRYLLMMVLRALCIVGAASTFRLSGWLAAAFVAAAVVLPWAAVLIANDRPPKQELRFRRFLVSDGADRPSQLTSGATVRSEKGPDGFGRPQSQPSDEQPQPRPTVIDL